MPKAIYIIESVPLTPVGKIFKPALRWDVIEKIYRKELEHLGDLVDSLSVAASEDKVHGTRVAITAKPATDVDPPIVEKKINEILARYTLHTSVTFDS